MSGAAGDGTGGGLDAEACALASALNEVAAAAGAARGIRASAFRPVALADTHAALVAAAGALDAGAVATLVGAGVRAAMFEARADAPDGGGGGGGGSGGGGAQSALAGALLGAEAATAADGAGTLGALRDAVAIATMLVDAGASLRAPAVPSGRMPLCIAAEVGHPPLLACLLRGHDAEEALRAVGVDGWAPARAAAGHGAAPRDGRDDVAVADILLRASVAAGVRVDWATEFAAATAFLAGGGRRVAPAPRPSALKAAITSACIFAAEWLVRDALDNGWLSSAARSDDRTLAGLGIAVCLMHDERGWYGDDDTAAREAVSELNLLNGRARAMTMDEFIPCTPRLFPFVDVLCFAGFRFAVFVDVSGARDGAAAASGGETADECFADARILLARDALPRQLRGGCLRGFGAWGEAARDGSSGVRPSYDDSRDCAGAHLVPAEAAEVARAVRLVLSDAFCGRGRCGPTAAEACLSCIDAAARATLAGLTSAGVATGGGRGRDDVSKRAAPGGVIYFRPIGAGPGQPAYNVRASTLAGCAVWGPALYVRARRWRVPRVEIVGRAHAAGRSVDELAAEWCRDGCGPRSHNALLRDTRRNGISRRQLGALYARVMERRPGAAAGPSALECGTAATPPPWACGACGAPASVGIACPACSRASDAHGASLEAWSCVQCTFVNSGAEQLCGMCGALAPLVVPRSAEASAAALGTRSVPSKRSRASEEDGTATSTPPPGRRRRRDGSDARFAEAESFSAEGASTTDSAMAPGPGGAEPLGARGHRLYVSSRVAAARGGNDGEAYVPGTDSRLRLAGSGDERSASAAKALAGYSTSRGASMRPAGMGVGEAAAGSGGGCGGGSGGGGGGTDSGAGIACPQCTFVNPPVEFSCVMCEYIFDGGVGAAVNLFDEFSQANSSPRAAGSLGTCNAFDVMADLDLIDGASTRVAVADDSEDEASPWVCSACTFMNDDGEFCDACGSPSTRRPRERVRSDDGDERDVDSGGGGPGPFVCTHCGVGDLSRGSCRVCDESAMDHESSATVSSGRIDRMLLTEMAVRALKECIYSATRSLVYGDASLSLSACVSSVISQWCQAMWSDARCDARWDVLAIVVRSKFEVHGVTTGPALRLAVDLTTLATRLVETIGIEFVNADKPADDIGRAAPGDLRVTMRPKLITDS